MTMNKVSVGALLFTLAMGLTLGGCSGGSTSIEIAGTYDDGFGTTHVVTADGWTMTYTSDGMSSVSRFDFTFVDDEADYAIAQNDAANAFSPNLYSRFEWTRVGSQLYFCQSTFDAPTEAAAMDADRPNRSDPATTGCGTFPWSRLSP